MDKILISLPRKENQKYPNGGNESGWMRRIAEEMARHLADGGIKAVLSPVGMRLPEKIRLARADSFRLYLALRSQVSAQGQGRRKGAEFLYDPHKPESRGYAALLAGQYRLIYPEPKLVREISAGLEELRRVKVPAVLVRAAYRDNPQDEIWLTQHTGAIAENLAQAVCGICGREHRHA